MKESEAGQPEAGTDGIQFSPTAAFYEYRFDWYPDKVVYYMLTGYHSGTNRATALMLARPGTLQPTNRRTFMHGVRMTGTDTPVERDTIIWRIYEHRITDGAGPDDVNQRLSEQRAQAVLNLLVRQFQVRPDRLLAVGFGPHRPADSNETQAGQQANRRVDFSVI